MNPSYQAFSAGSVQRPASDEREGGESMLEHIRSLFADAKEEAGQTMAEYAVVLAVITIAVVVTLGLLSSTISKQLNSVVGIL